MRTGAANVRSRGLTRIGDPTLKFFLSTRPVGKECLRARCERDLRPSHLINTERENRVQPATTPRRVAHSTPRVLAVAEHAARAAFVVSLTVSLFFKAILIRTNFFRGGWDRTCCAIRRTPMSVVQNRQIAEPYDDGL